MASARSVKVGHANGDKTTIFVEAGVFGRLRDSALFERKAGERDREPHR
jgi:hypothetical protein